MTESTMPKVVVTIYADRNKWDKLIDAIKENESYIDMIEYRADLCGERNADEYIEDVKQLKEHFPDFEIIFTYRTKGEGGSGVREPNDYFELCRDVVLSRSIDVIDIELLVYEEIMEQLLKLAHDNGVQVLISHHELEHTPSSKELKALYNRMKSLGADYSKLAVMPEDGRDVLKLLTALYETNQSCERHIVGIAMGDIGKLTRVAGGSFGSALTYGHVGEEAAPGQLHVKQLKALMDVYQ